MSLQQLPQRMDGTKIMGLHASFGTPHGTCRGCDIQFFPGAQHERLLLTEWQRSQGCFKRDYRPLSRKSFITRWSPCIGG
jgi:hypothetical protein